MHETKNTTIMKKTLDWLYENWMKGTPFLALYTFILIWIYVKEVDFCLFLVWFQCSAYWLHEFEEYVCPGGFLSFFNKGPLHSTLDEKPLSKAGSFWINIPLMYVLTVTTNCGDRTNIHGLYIGRDRKLFEAIMRRTGIPQPKARAVTNVEDGVKAASEIGYPVLVRPSFVLGGRAMMIVGNEDALRHYLHNAVEVNENSPVLVDKYIEGRETEVDAICDGTDVFIPGIMEHVEKTGVHSGDSISVYPSFSLSDAVKRTIIDYTVRLGREIGIVGLFNIQFIVDSDNNVYVIEVNPRSSRTVPFLSKSTGVPMAKIATLVMLGHSLKDQGITDTYLPESKRHYVKCPAFSFGKIKGIDTYLSPEMKSTGEAIGYDASLNRAVFKSLQASGISVVNYGTVLATIADKDKEDALPLLRRFYNLGFNIQATSGTAKFLKEHGVRTKSLGKISDGSNDIVNSLRKGHVTYVINTIDVNQHKTRLDGYEIRRAAVENNVTIFTALDTVRVLLNVLEEITLGISTIDAEYAEK